MSATRRAGRRHARCPPRSWRPLSSCPLDRRQRSEPKQRRPPEHPPLLVTGPHPNWDRTGPERPRYRAREAHRASRRRKEGGRVERTTRTAVLTTPPRDLAVVHELLQAFWTDLPGLEPLDRFAFETALVELAGNVVEHADDGHGLTCTIRLTAEEHSLAAQLQDTGRAADVSLAEHAMPDPLAERGRGLALVQRLVDDLAYERNGGVNRWRFARHLQGG